MLQSKGNRFVLSRWPIATAGLLLAAVACGGRAGESDDSANNSGGSSNGQTGGAPEPGSGGASGGEASGGMRSGGTGSGGVGSGGVGSGGVGSGGAPTGDGGRPNMLTECMKCEDGFECVEEVAFDRCFEVCPTDNPTVVLETQADVEALAALDCEIISRDLNITGPEITTLNGLGNIKVVRGELSVQATEALESLDGLDGLLYIDNAMRINGNTALAEISALAGMRAGEVVITVNSNPVLTTLDGLQGIKSPDDIQVAGNTTLADISGLSPNNVFDNISITSNALTTARFPDLYSVGASLSFTSEVAIEYLEFPTLDFVGGNILVPSNDALLAIDLSALTRVGSMVITDNEKLQTLGGLPLLMSVDSTLVITGNLSLPDCEVDEIASRFSECTYCIANDPDGVCD